MEEQQQQQQPQQEQQQQGWTEQTKELIAKFNIANLLFCYCLPFFYVFYPTLLMPAIFLRFLSFVIGWIYKLISAHHHHTDFPQQQQQQQQQQEKGLPSHEDDEMNNMYFWLQRCSICLDQTYSLCLESCRDQFCKDCFVRYIEETVKQSWGLGVARIKCPVCQEAIPQSEWSRYVSSEIIAKYNKYNQPYRPFSRYCSSCQHSVAPCQSPKAQSISRENQLEKIAKDLERFASLTQAINLKQRVQETLLDFLKACQKGGSFRIGRVQDIYHQIIPILCKIVNKQQPDLYFLASSISKQLVSLEVIPEAWKQTQFWHIANFPQETCSQCGDPVCLQCGELGHLGSSCLESLKLKLKENSSNQDLINTLQWKLNHTRPCPNCSVMINRDEGCNKVDCLLCVYKFCWRCGSGWSQCGFYQCKEENPVLLESEVQTNDTSSRAELGVPDMEAINARRQVNSL